MGKLGLCFAFADSTSKSAGRRVPKADGIYGLTSRTSSEHKSMKLKALQIVDIPYVSIIRHFEGNLSRFAGFLL